MQKSRAIYASPGSDLAGLDYSLYLVTDRALTPDRSLVEVVHAAVRGGVTCIQLREVGKCTEKALWA